jgi:large subunit ribosomal protein L24
MKLNKGDKVKILAGKDKGKTGTVLKVLIAKGKIVVEGVGVVKKHVKPGAVSKEGGIVSIEKPIDASNAMYFDEKLGKTVRIGYKITDGKKQRINKKTGEALKN